MRITNQTRTGLTLLEMVVVVVIMAMLAATVIPLVSSTMDRSQSAVQASSLNDAARSVEAYFNMHKSYPDGWDTLVKGDESGLYSNLHPSLFMSGGRLVGASIATLPADQAAGMSLVGINNIYHHDELALHPSDSGTVPSPLSVSKVVKLNKANVAALLGDDFNLTTAQVSDHDFVIFGFGPHNRSVGQTIQQAPLLVSLAPGLYYSRSLVIFAVRNTGMPVRKAAFIGAIGPDGRSLRGSLNGYNTPMPE